MKAYTFSIGLNTGDTEDPDQLNKVLRALANNWRVLDLRLGASEWKGTPERFVQVRMECLSAADSAQFLAKYLKQSAVAVLAGTAWKLVDPAGKVVDGGPVSEYPVIL